MPPLGTPPSSTPVVSTGMSSTTQCVNVPDGASGSSTTSARAAASWGTPVQLSGGATLASSQVYRAGTGAPSSKAELVTVMVSGTSGSCLSGDWSLQLTTSGA